MQLYAYTFEQARLVFGGDDFDAANPAASKGRQIDDGYIIRQRAKNGIDHAGADVPDAAAVAFSRFDRGVNAAPDAGRDKRVRGCLKDDWLASAGAEDGCFWNNHAGIAEICEGHHTRCRDAIQPEGAAGRHRRAGFYGLQQRSRGYDRSLQVEGGRLAVGDDINDGDDVFLR